MSKHKYPTNLLRLTGLSGGQYGTVDVIARARDLVELNFGGDFVQLSRRDAEASITALQTFLAMGEEHPPASDRPRHHPHRDRDSERLLTVTERVEERVEVTEPTPRRRSRRSATPERAER